MRQERAEKIIDYVRSMVDLYDNDPLTVLDDLKERDTEVEQAMEKVYNSCKGQVFCSSCNNMKMRDERKDEYYCPRCN